MKELEIRGMKKILQEIINENYFLLNVTENTRLGVRSTTLALTFTKGKVTIW